jgi:hypothetical protein
LCERSHKGIIIDRQDMESSCFGDPHDDVIVECAN